MPQNVKSEQVITTTGLLRATLAAALEKAANGELPAADGKNIIGLANQITTSMAVELKHQNMQSVLGQEVALFGNINIGG